MGQFPESFEAGKRIESSPEMGGQRFKSDDVRIGFRRNVDVIASATEFADALREFQVRPRIDVRVRGLAER
jgi:hypothetical protein